MEGYVTDRSTSAPTSPYFSPTRPRPALPSEARFFWSANDVLRDVYSTHPSTGYRVPQSPANKRGRVRSEEPDGDAAPKDSDIEMQVTDPEADGHSLPTFTGFEATLGASRPMKPLKRSGRQFVQTRSLPSGPLQFSSDPRPRDWLLDSAAKSVEDDWSKDLSDIKFIQDMDF
jgi:hypothetical protein